ncbi:hypothetical protein ABK040_001608 [Willaertia magna]
MKKANKDKKPLNNTVHNNVKNDNPYFNVDKFQPLLGESLPPKVQGLTLGEVYICVHCISWETDYRNIHFLIHPLWWGSDERFVELIPPTTEEEIVKEKSRISVVYPIKRPEEIFIKYLFGAKALTLLVINPVSKEIMGEAEIPLIGLNSNSPINKQWFNVRRADFVIAHMQVSLAITFFSSFPPQTEKSPTTIGALKREMSPIPNTETKFLLETPPPQHIQVQKQPFQQVKFSNDVNEKLDNCKDKLEEKVVTNPFNTPPTNTIKKPNELKTNLIANLLQNANQLGQQFNQYFADSNIPLVDTQLIQLLNNSSSSINSTPRKGFLVDDSFSPSISTVSSRATERKELLSEISFNEEEEDDNEHQFTSPIQQQPVYGHPPYFPFFAPPRNVIPPFFPPSDKMCNNPINEQPPLSPITSPKKKQIEKGNKTPEKPIHQHTHLHAHLHIKEETNPQVVVTTKFCIMFHVIAATLLKKPEEEHNTYKVKMQCRLPFGGERGKSTQYMVVTHNEEVRVNTYEIFAFSNQKTFLPKFNDCSFVIELFDSKNNFLGLSMLELSKFFEVFSKEEPPVYLFPHKEEPVIGHYGPCLCTNPITNETICELNAVLAFGSESQVKGFLNYQRAAMTIQTFFRTSMSKSKDRNNNKKEENEIEEIHYIPQREDNCPQKRIEKDLPTLLQNEAKIVMPQNELEEHFDSYEEDLISQNSNESYEIPDINVQRQTKIYIPSCIPLPTYSILTFKIKRATGLKEAAILCSTHNSHVRLACQIGLNPFIEFEGLFEDEKVIQTSIQAKTFCPVWNFEKDFELLLDESTYLFFMQKEIIFNVYHKIEKSRVVGATTPSNTLLGTVSISLNQLFTSRNGINGWFDIFSSENNQIGTLDISIHFDEGTVNSLFCNHFTTEKIIGPPFDICRFTIILEELIIPKDIVKELTPFYILERETMYPCYFFVSYKFYKEKRVESRLYKASSSLDKLTLHHTVEFKKILDQETLKQISQDKLAIDIFFSVQEEKKENEKSIRANAKLLGTAYVDVIKLLDKRKLTKDKIVWIGGLYRLINTDTESVSNGNIKLKINCESITNETNNNYTKYNIVNVKEKGVQYSDNNDSEDEEQSPLKENGEPEFTKAEYDLKFQELDDEILKTSTSKRVRASVTTTYSRSIASEPIDPQELIELINETKTPMKSPIKTPPTKIVNYLNVYIEEAFNLPLQTSVKSIKPKEPSTNVAIVSKTHSIPQEIKTHFTTKVIESDCNPKWNEYYQMPLTAYIDTLIFQVWHYENNNVSPKLIGQCFVDVTGLSYGMRRIDGWYHIEDVEKRQNIIAQLKVAISAEQPVDWKPTTNEIFQDNHANDEGDYQPEASTFVANIDFDNLNIEDLIQGISNSKPIIEDEVEIDENKLANDKEKLKTMLEDLDNLKNKL